MTHRVVVTLVVFALSAALMFLLMDRTVDIFDEGLILSDVMRTLAGDVVHRDYYSPYPSGYYYLISAAFRLTEYHFIAARIVGIAVMAGLVSATFFLLVGRIRLPTSLLFTAIVGGWLIASPKYLYPLFPCLLFALVGTGLVLRGCVRREPWPLFLGGCCAGAAAVFRYDGGFFLLLANLAGLAILTALERTAKKPIQQCLRDMALYGAGTASVFAPCAVAFLMTGSLAAFLADIIDYPLNYYVAMRKLPFPGLLDVTRHPSLGGVYLPVVAAVLAIGQLTLMIRRRPSPAQSRTATSDVAFLVLFSALTITFFYKGMVRVSPLHMMMSIVPANLLLALWVDRSWRPGAVGVATAAALAAAAVPSAAATGRTVASHLADPSRTFLGQALAASEVEDGARTDACLTSRATAGSRTSSDYAVIASYLRRFSARDERIFVGLNRHDKIFVNAIGLYFLADRLPGTRWHQFDPGLQTRRDIQQRIIADLIRHQVRWIVRDGSFEGVNEPNGSRLSSGVHDLDRYISAHFSPVARSGPVEIWLSAGSPAPRLTGFDTCMPQAVTNAAP